VQGGKNRGLRAEGKEERRRIAMSAKYGKKAQETVRDTMEKFKKGQLKSGSTGKKVTDRKQAVAIGLSEAREKHTKVPPPPRKK
jgi:hypothetical protein